MCNHYQAHIEAMASMAAWADYVDALKEAGLDELPHDVWPKRPALVMRWEREPVAEAMIWGVPLPMKGKTGQPIAPKPVTNVRNLDSNFWRSMLTTPAQRCLVPFSRFAEPKKGAGRDEHWFTLPDQPVAAFAGIWRDSEAGKVFAFLTCEPNSLVAPLHPKAMPVILDPDQYRSWLTEEALDVKTVAQPYPSQLMKVD